MGTIVNVIDSLALFTPYLTWQHPLSLVILQLSIISTLLLLFLTPLIPMRYFFLVLGEVTLLAGHPFIKSLIKSSIPLLLSERSTSTSLKSYKKVCSQLLEEDTIPPQELEGEIKWVERMMSEIKMPDGNWGSDLVHVDSRGLPNAGEGEGKWKWVSGFGWEIDEAGEWAEGKVDKGSLRVVSSFFTLWSEW